MTDTLDLEILIYTYIYMTIQNAEIGEKNLKIRRNKSRDR